MRKKNWTKIMAFLALFWIIIWVIWTWLLIIFDNPSSTEQTLTQEEYNRLLEQINSNTWIINSWTWIWVSTWVLIWTWEIK